MQKNILSGIKIFDMTRVLAGPYCTALLADLGAEVIKLEPPTGDEYRHIGPFVEGESALFQLTNRGKKSIAIDLRQAEGKRLAEQLALSCDVVVENFRPGVATKLGLGANQLRQKKPSLIYASISGFGQTGPWTEKPAYDLVVQALSGMMAVNGEENGNPLKVGESMGDLAAGLFASWAILAALFRHQKSGEGATIDVSMHDALFSLLPTAHAQLFYGQREPQRSGNRHTLSTPFGCYRAKDGFFALAVLNEKHFAIFAETIGHAGLGNDARFASDKTRTENEPALKMLIESWSLLRSIEDIIADLSAREIPCAPIRGFGQAATSEQTLARNLVTKLDHHKLGNVNVVGQPVVFDGHKPIATMAAPDLGGDARKILSGLAGFDQQSLAKLFESKILVEAKDAEPH